MVLHKFRKYLSVHYFALTLSLVFYGVCLVLPAYAPLIDGSRGSNTQVCRAGTWTNWTVRT